MIRAHSSIGVALVACGLTAGCSAPFPAAAGDGTGTSAPGPCATASSGCACPVEGETVACGKVKQQIGTFVECSMGRRTCASGTWGDCVGDLVVTKTFSPLHTSALADAGGCTGNPCDPYCSQYSDKADPSVVPADAGLTLADGGLTLIGSGVTAVTCTSLTIAPTNGAMTVTSVSPFTTSPATLGFTATFLPAGCAPAGLQPTWTVDRADLATISSSGQLSLFGGVAGLDIIKVQAFFGSLVSNQAPVDVLVKTKESVSVAPNTAAPSGQVAKFWSDVGQTIPAAGVTTTDVSWLYPYADTWFPLALPAPVLMYKMAANPGNTVKVVLRYPSGSTATTSTFEGAFFVKEGACSDTTQCYSKTPGDAVKDVQIVIPPALWKAFEQTAKGSDADIVVQRWDSSALQVENVRRVHFANGQLKGTVWYSSYNSALVGYTGAVLKISPGATAPTVGIQIGGKCTTCHSMNLDGSRAIANGFRYPSGGSFTDSQMFDTASAPTGSPLLTSVLKQYNNGSGTPNPGIRFNYAAPRTDGTVYLTHGGGTGGDPNWRAPADVSKFYNPSTVSTLSTTGWTNIQAVTPRFSVAGDRIAFGYWSAGTALSKLPSGTLAADSTGKTIAVADFSCTGTPCSSVTVSNARNVTPGMSNQVAWPTFSPDGASVVYHRQLVASNSILASAWSPSPLNSVAGAQADLWISNITPTSATASTPTQLKAANGLNSAGVSYLPTIPRDVNPALTSTNYHVPGTSFTIKQADGCSNSGTAGGGSYADTRLNYLPSFMPVEAGGMHWVVFTSRRMYGSVAYGNPWDADPTQSCSSGIAPTKKLWVAAVDKTWTPGTDPSHPAFYLPGQELAAGNANAYWVNSPCGGVAAACSTDADCCQSPSAEQCRIDLPASTPVTRSCRLATSCLPQGAVCTSTSDCCGSPTIQCVGSGTKVCASLGAYQPATFTRDFTASCLPGFTPVWQSFAWQADATPSGSIDFSAQTGDTFAVLGASVPIGSATSATLAPSWATSPSTVDQALKAATPAQTSHTVLRVTMKLNTNGTVAPTLYSWRQYYDCVPTE